MLNITVNNRYAMAKSFNECLTRYLCEERVNLKGCASKSRESNSF